MRGVGIDDWEMGTRALDCGTELTWRLSVVRDSSRRYKGGEEVGEEKKKREKEEREVEMRKENINRRLGSKFRASMTHCSVNNVIFRTWGTFR